MFNWITAIHLKLTQYCKLSILPFSQMCPKDSFTQQLRGMGSGVPLNKQDWSLNREVKVTQSCSTLCNPMDCIVLGILQARMLEWVAYPFSSRSSQPRNQTQVSCIAGGSFTSWASGKPGVWTGQDPKSNTTREWLSGNTICNSKWPDISRWNEEDFQKAGKIARCSKRECEIRGCKSPKVTPQRREWKIVPAHVSIVRVLNIGKKFRNLKERMKKVLNSTTIMKLPSTKYFQRKYN